MLFEFYTLPHQHVGKEQKWMVIHCSLDGISEEYFNSVLTGSNTISEYSIQKSTDYDVCL